MKEEKQRSDTVTEKKEEQREEEVERWRLFVFQPQLVHNTLMNY